MKILTKKRREMNPIAAPPPQAIPKVIIVAMICDLHCKSFIGKSSFFVEQYK
jgi:hypothetical protein